MLSQQIKNELPADLILTIMQYACYKTHPTAKMIKEAVACCEWDGVDLNVVCCVNLKAEMAVLYIERDCAEMFKEVDYHSELIDGEVEVVDWFQQVTDRYADCSDEYRDNLIIYSKMIREARYSPAPTIRPGGRERAWGLYKIISDCPTSVY